MTTTTFTFVPETQPDWIVTVKRGTGPQVASYVGAWQQTNANTGEVAVRIATRHIMAIDGDGVTFQRSNPDRLDDVPAAIIYEVAQQVISGGRMTEEDAKN